MSLAAAGDYLPSWGLTDLLQHSAALLFLGIAAEVLHRLAGAKLSPRLRGWLWSALLLRSLIPPGIGGLRTVSVQSGGAESLQVVGEIPSWLLAAWALGFIVCLAAALRFRAPVGRGASPQEQHFLQSAFARLRFSGPAPRILIGIDDRLRAPAVFGSLRQPCLWLPEDWLSEERSQDLLRALAHELSHLERRDLWRARASQLWCAVFWFHPVAHLTALRLGELREIACDRAAALRMGESPATYGTWLAQLALADRPIPRTGLALGGRPHALLHRVESVMRSRALSKTRLSLRLMEVLALGLFLGVVLPPRTRASAVHPEPVALEDPGCLEFRYRVLADLAKSQGPLAHGESPSSSPSFGALLDEARSNPTHR